MEPISVREVLALKRMMFAAWELLPPAHRWSVLVCFAYDPPTGGWVVAARALNELMEQVKRAGATRSHEGAAAPDEARPIRALLVDGCPAFRAGLRLALASVEVPIEVTETGTVAEAMELASTARPDIAVVDADLPDMGGVQLCGWLSDERPETRTLLMSAFDWDIYLAQVVLVGASGFVWKNAELGELAPLIRRAAVEDVFTERQDSRFDAWLDDFGRGFLDVTAREMEVFRLVVAGNTHGQIAEELALSENTVGRHIGDLCEKLHVRSKLKLAALWIRQRLDAWALGVLRHSTTRKMVDLHHDRKSPRLVK